MTDRAAPIASTATAADWGAFLRERHLLILEWTREGRSVEFIRRTLSMDAVQVELIAATPEESTRPHARPAAKRRKAAKR